MLDKHRISVEIMFGKLEDYLHFIHLKYNDNFILEKMVLIAFSIKNYISGIVKNVNDENLDIPLFKRVYEAYINDFKSLKTSIKNYLAQIIEKALELDVKSGVENSSKYFRENICDEIMKECSLV